MWNFQISFGPTTEQNTYPAVCPVDRLVRPFASQRNPPIYNAAGQCFPENTNIFCWGSSNMFFERFRNVFPKTIRVFRNMLELSKKNICFLNVSEMYFYVRL